MSYQTIGNRGIEVERRDDLSGQASEHGDRRDLCRSGVVTHFERTSVCACLHIGALSILSEAKIDAYEPQHCDLAQQRDDLLTQLDRAQVEEIADLTCWSFRSLRAYEERYRSLSTLRREVLTELLGAATAAEELERLNRCRILGHPVGEEALKKLSRSILAIQSLPAPKTGAPRTGGVILGRTPPVFAEARLAAAAVLAALEVQRRRLANLSAAESRAGSGSRGSLSRCSP